MNAKQIQGLAVIGIDEATSLGAIDRIFLDPAERRVVGFTVDTSGQSALSRQTFGAMLGASKSDPVITGYIRAEDVHSLGPDALTIENRGKLTDHTTEPDSPASAITADALVKHKVITENGVRVGQIAAIEIDPLHLVLTQVEVSPGFFKGNTTIPAHLIASIGSELIVVANEVAEAPAQPDGEREGDQGDPRGQTEAGGPIESMTPTKQPAS